MPLTKEYRTRGGVVGNKVGLLTHTGEWVLRVACRRCRWSTCIESGPSLERSLRAPPYPRRGRPYASATIQSVLTKLLESLAPGESPLIRPEGAPP